MAVIDAPAQVTWQQDLLASTRGVSAGILGGLATGALIGGIGGRLAMFVLRLTSDPALHGVTTDDGFTIGRFSAETLILVILVSALGILGGIAYLAVRTWMPRGWRAPLTGVFGGIVGGALFVNSDGVDFTLLEPLPLAIAMFVALPAIYGVALSMVVERLLRSTSEVVRSPAWLVGLVPAIAFGVFGLALVALMLGVWWIHWLAPERAASVWRSPAVVWTGRAILLAVAARSLVSLLADVDQIL